MKTDNHIKDLEDLIDASQKVIIRQQREIKVLRDFIDSVNKEHYITWDEFLEGKRK